jgi:hypothetical protein
VTVETESAGAFEPFVGFVAADLVAAARVLVAAQSLASVPGVTVVIFTAEA